MLAMETADVRLSGPSLGEMSVDPGVVASVNVGEKRLIFGLLPLTPLRGAFVETVKRFLEFGSVLSKASSSMHWQIEL